jgi:hypothetical protein
MLREENPGLAWLKQEFHVSDAEFARICRMHEAYLPECHHRCQRIQEQNEQLHELLARSTNVTPQVQALLAERAKTRGECEAAMLSHFLAVSQTMPPEEGRRYLAWVESQSSLWGMGMEEQHRPADERR